MPSAARMLLLLVPLASFVPSAFHSETLAGWKNCCCRVCYCPLPQCTCAVPQPIERDVTVTEYRNEAVNETVPTTYYENVTVDEGSYQSVWVPRLTTKAVARTTYQTRTSYRSVPYQVTRRITDYSYGTTTLGFVPRSSVTVGAAPVYAPSAPYSGAPSTVSASPYSGGSGGTSSASSRSLPVVTESGLASTLNSSTGIRAVPEPRMAGDSTPIRPRRAMQFDNDAMASRSNDGSAINRGPSLFAPAPSAAQVWRTPRGTMTR